MLRYPSTALLFFLMSLMLSATLAAATETGEASYYADSLNGNKTASGEPYDKNAMTAAHRTLPFGTRVKVTRVETGESVELVINDRGPHVKNRIIDVSGAAAGKLGLRKVGHAQVTVEVLDD